MLGWYIHMNVLFASKADTNCAFGTHSLFATTDGSFNTVVTQSIWATRPLNAAPIFKTANRSRSYDALSF
jgi:hypothetical protein